ncbi:Ig-like domain repeat protein [Streptomyces sp. NPDC004539]|uniref:Ig-like domain repeat protein n=1 Tax=Streptomyces sp. NPDC004539 TaxID=3154280 RepID=UPI0033BA4BE9
MRVRHATSRTAATATSTVAVLLGCACLTGAGAQAAAADSQATLPISADWPRGEMVVDGVHRRVFISDPKTDSVVVADYTGKTAGRITGEAGSAGMVLSEDSSTLYVALPDADAISAVDTVTLKETARYATGADTAPLDLALAGGKLWFGYGAYARGGGNIGSLDLSGTGPAVTLDQSGGVPWESAPQLTTAPGGGGGVLVAGNKDRSPEEIAVYDVSSGTAQQRAYRKEIMPETLAGQEDLAVSPDGREIVTADGVEDFVMNFAADLSGGKSVRTLPIQGEPNAVEYAANGALAVGVRYGKGVDTYVYRPGDSWATRFVSTGLYNSVQPHGLAWAPDSSRLFILTSDGASGKNLVLRTIDDAAKAVTKLSVSAPAKAPLDRKLTLTGTFGFVRPDLPGSVPIEVTRADLASPKGKPLGTRTVWLSRDRVFTIEDTPQAGGKVTYTLRYPGDATHAPVTATAAVVVPRNRTTLTLAGNAKTVKTGKNATVTAKLGKTWKERKVSVYAQPAGGAKKLVRTAVVNRDGKLVITYKVTKNTTFTAVFGGDARTEPMQATTSVKAGKR